MWVVPALVLLVRDGRRQWAAGVYVLFCLSPLWWVPRVYGFDWANTIVADCYLLSGLAFVGYTAWLLRLPRRFGTEGPELLVDLGRSVIDRARRRQVHAGDDGEHADADALRVTERS